MAGTHNPLLPEMATVIETVQETHNIKTFRVRFDDEEKNEKLHLPARTRWGQALRFSAWGESTFPWNPTLSPHPGWITSSSP